MPKISVLYEKTGELFESYPGAAAALNFGLFSLDLPGRARQFGPVLCRDDTAWSGDRFVRCQGSGLVICYAGATIMSEADFLAAAESVVVPGVSVAGSKPAQNILRFLAEYDGRALPEEWI